MYCPLYPPEGGPVMGFACRECGNVTKTEQGMLRHCLYAHGKKPQLELELSDGQAAKHVRQRASAEEGSGETYPGASDSIYRRTKED
jgi:molybdenum cofactor biosynthesis enzyme MoaA